MNRIAVRIAMLVAGAAGSLAQTPSVLQIDVVNTTLYVHDVTDYSKLASDPAITTRQVSRNFNGLQFIGDIVAVNGKPVKGTWTTTGRSWGLSPAPVNGQAMADTTRGWSEQQIFEILQADGSAIGSLVAEGFRQGSIPPGMNVANGTGTFAITGGTGAFLAARGQGAQVSTVAARAASVTEDPTYRRDRNGGTLRFTIQLVPLTRPEVMTSNGAPAVVRASDFSRITAANPARPGEILSVFATGLGPTRPSVNPGTAFPANPLALTAAPVDVTVNGAPAEVIGAAGFPGSTDGYQVNFRVPADATAGNAAVQLSAAWVAGPAVTIPVRP